MKLWTDSLESALTIYSVILNFQKLKSNLRHFWGIQMLKPWAIEMISQAKTVHFDLNFCTQSFLKHVRTRNVLHVLIRGVRYLEGCPQNVF